MNAFFVEQVGVPGPSIKHLCYTHNHGVTCSSGNGYLRVISNMQTGTYASNSNIKTRQAVTQLESHEDLLAISDSTGLVEVLELSAGPHTVVFSRSLSNSSVCSLVIHPSGQGITVGFGSGQVSHLNLTSTPIWSIDLKNEIQCLQWARDGLVLAAYVSGQKHVSLYDVNGLFFHNLELSFIGPSDAIPGTAAMAWGPRGIAFCSGDGKGQIVVSVLDSDCTLIDCQAVINSISWCDNGDCLAIASRRCIFLYSWTGHHIKTVTLTDTLPGTISPIVWDERSRRMFVAVDNILCTLAIPRVVKKAYCRGTCAITTGPNELTIFPSASKVSIPNLNDVRIFGSTIAVAVRSGDSFDIQLLSLSGFLLERRRLMEFPELTGFTFDGTTVALASRSIIQRWNILTKELSYIQINDLNLANKGLAPDEFHRTVEDSILDICFSADGALAVARESGLIHILVSGKLEKTISLMTRPEKIFLNCDASLVAIIDMENKLHIADTETFTSSLTTRDECWDAVWADDDPLMLACMDKSRLYVLRGASGKPEEPLLLNGNVLMGIGNLEIVTISDALRKVEQFPTKSLRDFKQVLEAATQLEDSYDFVHRAPHPRLWYLLAEHALLLEPARLDIAVRAYDQCNCIDGKEAVGYFASIPDPVEQRMEILFMLGRQKECEELTAIRGREDLWLRAKKRVGDFESISKSAKWNTVASPREIAEYLYGAMKFDQALEWFRKTDDLSPNYLRALLLTNKFEELVHVSESLNLDKATLTNVARILGMTGLCKPSANFFARAGDVGAAFKVCADWHRWDLIQALENQHGRHYDKRDASRLVKTGQYIQAVEVIRYGGDKNVLKPILQKLYGIFLDWRTRKMLAVINGVELDTWRRAEAIHFLVMGQAAIYASKFSQAVQILKKLSGLMDVFTPGERIEAYKLQALAGLFNKDRSFCSNAITKLEVFRGDHQYKDLALALFSKSWTDVTISAYPNAGPVEESAMDMARDRSISGAPLVLEVRDASFRCKRCSCTVDGKIPSNLCPICHTVI